MPIFFLFCLASLLAIGYIAFRALTLWGAVSKCPPAVINLIVYMLYALALLVVTISIAIGVMDHLLSKGVMP